MPTKNQFKKSFFAYYFLKVQDPDPYLSLVDPDPDPGGFATLGHSKPCVNFVQKLGKKATLLDCMVVPLHLLLQWEKILRMALCWHIFLYEPNYACTINSCLNQTFSCRLCCGHRTLMLGNWTRILLFSYEKPLTFIKSLNLRTFRNAVHRIRKIKNPNGRYT